MANQPGTVSALECKSRGGAELGYPALILDPDGTPIAVDLFESLDLPAHLARLDQFEGSGYQRIVTTVRTPAARSTRSSTRCRPALSS